MKYTTCFFLVAIATNFALAGSLTPPGSPSSTMKTLTDVEPRTAIYSADIPLIITEPGSYYLAESIHVAADAGLTTAAVIIQSGYVTIDLNGYTLQGSDTSGISGIYADGHMENIVIRNGYVSHWEEYAIYLNIDASLVEDTHVAENDGSGIVMTAGKVINCTVRNNGLNGITFRPSQSNGVVAGTCLIHLCEIFDNGEAGISASRLITVSETMCTRNGGSGILLTAGGSTIKNSTFSDNRNCGILTGEFAENCLISGNNCHRNGESGIAINSRGCRVEENHLTSNQIDGLTLNQRSYAFKNTAYDNVEQNYSFVGEAIAGPIITTTSGGIITSEHPWANFSFHTLRIGN